MARSEQEGIRYFIGYGFLKFLPYEDYLDELLYWVYEDYDGDYMIVGSMGEYRYTIAKEIE